MTNREALSLVFDLANENALDKHDSRVNGLMEEYNKQQRALRAIDELINLTYDDDFATPHGGWDYEV